MQLVFQSTSTWIDKKYDKIVKKYRKIIRSTYINMILILMYNIIYYYSASI